MVDQFGCPPPQAPTDSDGDGVPDERDRCPGSPAGAPVDALGCTVPGHGPATATAAHPPRREFRDRQCDPQRHCGSVTPGDGRRRCLAQPAVRLEVAGYTDDTGSRAVNERLSQARAESVRAFLVSAGVPADQLTARGYGPADPIATNGTPAGRALNRRVELKRVE